MTTTVGKFTLPETHAAMLRWCEITGLSPESAEWGEVWQVLSDTRLLDGDQPQQQHLFDDPNAPVFESLLTRNLKLAIVAGALLHRQRSSLDPATATAVVAALLEELYGGMATWHYEGALNRLEVELPRRVLHLADSPADALAWQLGPVAAGLAEAPGFDDAQRSPELAAVVEEVRSNDEFAQKVFARLLAVQQVGLVDLSFGGWLVYNAAYPL